MLNIAGGILLALLALFLLSLALYAVFWGLAAVGALLLGTAKVASVVATPLGKALEPKWKRLSLVRQAAICAGGVTIVTMLLGIGSTVTFLELVGMALTFSGTVAVAAAIIGVSRRIQSQGRNKRL